MTVLYRGFSFKGWQENKSFVLTDVDLVKRDLLNHLYTRRGSRVGHRGFGTTIQDLVFEPMDQNTITLVSDQVRAVIDYDPRVTLITEDDYQVLPNYDESRLSIAAQLYYVELGLTDIFHINLEFQA